MSNHAHLTSLVMVLRFHSAMKRLLPMAPAPTASFQLLAVRELRTAWYHTLVSLIMALGTGTSCMAGSAVMVQANSASITNGPIFTTLAQAGSFQMKASWTRSR